MTTRLSARAMVTALLCAAAVFALAGSAEQVYYPDGYRLWTVAKFKLIGPQSPNYEKQGGFRHHFANEKALASWGRFRDGAIIVDERVHASLDPQGVWQAGDLAHVAVMRKDGEHHADTGGWYFNFFSGNDQAVGITPAQAKARCFEACHQSQAARDYVFSEPRR